MVHKKYLRLCGYKKNNIIIVKYNYYMRDLILEFFFSTEMALIIKYLSSVFHTKLLCEDLFITQFFII